MVSARRASRCNRPRRGTAARTGTRASGPGQRGTVRPGWGGRLTISRAADRAVRPAAMMVAAALGAGAQAMMARWLQWAGRRGPVLWPLPLWRNPRRRALVDRLSCKPPPEARRGQFGPRGIASMFDGVFDPRWDDSQRDEPQAAGPPAPRRRSSQTRPADGTKRKPKERANWPGFAPS
jgi:hypothetical protein